MKKTTYFILGLALLITLSACGQKQNGVDSPPSPNDTATVEQTAPPKTGETIVVIETNKGTVKSKFFPGIAPETVKNFTELAKKGFYDGLTFHRVIPDFMIQGGDPLGTGGGGETYKGPGTMLKAEFSTKLKHIKGAVSMARKGNDINSASSQFFIVQPKEGAAFLNNQYTVFGQVFEGFDVVDTIANVARDANDKPKEPIVMKKVTITAF